MWLVLAPAPVPDAPYWPGRRLLAFLDAAFWPAGWIALAINLPAPSGVVAPLLVAVAGACAIGRMHRALFVNHRYRFTTLRWGKVSLSIVGLGLALKLMAPF